MSENDAASLCTNDDDRSLLSSAKKQIFDSRLSKKVRNCSKKIVSAKTSLTLSSPVYCFFFTHSSS